MDPVRYEISILFIVVISCFQYFKRVAFINDHLVKNEDVTLTFSNETVAARITGLRLWWKASIRVDRRRINSQS